MFPYEILYALAGGGIILILFLIFGNKHKPFPKKSRGLPYKPSIPSDSMVEDDDIFIAGGCENDYTDSELLQIYRTMKTIR